VESGVEGGEEFASLVEHPSEIEDSDDEAGDRESGEERE
jgi:hypothetical protein